VTRGPLDSILEWCGRHGYNSQMKQVGIAELKNKLSEYLRLVRQGETIEILDRNIPVARIERVTSDRDSSQAAVEQLVREGIVERARRKPNRTWMKQEPIRCRGSAVLALIEERGRQ